MSKLRGSRRDWIVGFTCGAFDLFHVGHLTFLEACRRQCDELHIGVNSDASIKLYKSRVRPIIPQEERIQILQSLWDANHYIHPFDEEHPYELLSLIHPDIYFKGGDYTLDNLTSRPLVESWGGQVVIVPRAPGSQSTSAIIETIRRRYPTDPRATYVP